MPSAEQREAFKIKAKEIIEFWDIVEAAETGAERSQRLFEAMFDHKPRVDTRTPADIRNGVKLP